MAQKNVPNGYGTLVLSRKRGQVIIVGSGLIEITVAEIRGDKVRLMISAPKELRVMRAELIDQ